MSRITALLASLWVLLMPAWGRAAFHIAVIDEVMSGAGGNPNVQYVEIRTLSAGQNFMCHSRLTVFKCLADGGGSQVLINDLGGASAVNPCLSDATAGHRWITASPSAATFLAASGITPDFTWNNSATGNIPTSCGMVCWGAPSNTVPPNPPTWDATNPANYVDCVAYGPYDGTAEPLGTPAATATPGGGTFSLTRTGDTGFSNDFHAACPSPTASGGTQTPGSFGTCSPPTTTTTTTTGTGTTSTTTSTTIPGTGPSKCTSKEFGAAGKKASAKVKCDSKAVKKGDTSKLGGCNSKAMMKFDAKFGKAMSKGSCITTADTSTVESTVDNFVTALHNQLVGASTAASKCTAKELAAAGKLAGAEAKCYAKSIGKGDPSTISPCVMGAKTTFEGAFGAAMTGASNCLQPTVTVGNVETTVDTFISNLKGHLAP